MHLNIVLQHYFNLKIQRRFQSQEASCMRNEDRRNNEEDIVQRIDLLTEQLRELNVQRNQTEREIRELQNLQVEKAAERLRNNRHRVIRRQREAERRLKEAAKDRYGNLIVLGDRVKFLTTGLYRSTEGIVTKINKSRITAKDHRGIPISRSPHNVAVVLEEERSSDSHSQEDN